MSWLRETFGTGCPIIAMVHLPALPGMPLYDAAGGMRGILASAGRDIAALQGGGVDAVMFGNENDRPYSARRAGPGSGDGRRDRRARPAAAGAVRGGPALGSGGHRRGVRPRGVHRRPRGRPGPLGTGRRGGPAPAPAPHPARRARPAAVHGGGRVRRAARRARPGGDRAQREDLLLGDQRPVDVDQGQPDLGRRDGVGHWPASAKVQALPAPLAAAN